MKQNTIEFQEQQLVIKTKKIQRRGKNDHKTYYSHQFSRDVDFLSEVKAVLKVANGALVVIDRVESLCIQTKTVMRIINLF